MNMKNNLEQLMNKAKEMQEKMQAAQKEIEQLFVTGEAGGGLVKVEMNGRHDVRRVHINPSAVSDIEILEDLVAAAVNDANRKIEKETKSRIGSLTAGMDIPGGFGLLGG